MSDCSPMCGYVKVSQNLEKKINENQSVRCRMPDDICPPETKTETSSFASEYAHAWVFLCVTKLIFVTYIHAYTYTDQSAPIGFFLQGF